MANPTMTLIASNTVGSGGVSSVTFSSIPATYTDLKVVLSTRHNAGSGNWNEFVLGYNGGTSAGGWRALFGSGSAASSTSDGSTSYAGESATSNNTANTFANTEIYIPNYMNTASTKYFSVNSVTESNATSAIALMSASYMTGTSAGISSLTFTPTSGSFVQYSTFYIYGISNS